MFICAILAVLTILFIRNGTGLLIILAAAAASVALALFTPPAFAGHVVIVLDLALMVAAFRDVVKVIYAVKDGRRNRVLCYSLDGRVHASLGVSALRNGVD
ncbi:hypothetical protein D477_007973 [Arthrobacter crystallopoietes BAB-32]|uniref:Uncharacterized protein n=1 Tax=Arthrobacter crystallopoietes BAB-32 TaxID=1246476 RepID=N1V944_9MICC|nr:M50 family metallopeptidase [Arthrobacter crystallopoietes]EMY34773.1 hypothetical protein D477_007973 [Arthrobacter crystallopoietes BAB-32]